MTQRCPHIDAAAPTRLHPPLPTCRRRTGLQLPPLHQHPLHGRGMDHRSLQNSRLRVRQQHPRDVVVHAQQLCRRPPHGGSHGLPPCLTPDPGPHPCSRRRAPHARRHPPCCHRGAPHGRDLHCHPAGTTFFAAGLIKANGCHVLQLPSGVRTSCEGASLSYWRFCS